MVSTLFVAVRAGGATFYAQSRTLRGHDSGSRSLAFQKHGRYIFETILGQSYNSCWITAGSSLFTTLLTRSLLFFYSFNLWIFLLFLPFSRLSLHHYHPGHPSATLTALFLAHFLNYYTRWASLLQARSWLNPSVAQCWITQNSGMQPRLLSRFFPKLLSHIASVTHIRSVLFRIQLSSCNPLNVG